MRKEVYEILRKFSEDTFTVDRIIVSAYIRSNNISHVLNCEIKRHIIAKEEELSDRVTEVLAHLSTSRLSIEDVIALFEFVISPADKIVTGAVYTPTNIRQYIVEKCLEQAKNLAGIKICDPACGCAGFLFTAALILKKKTQRTFREIFTQNIYGLDIQNYSIKRSELLLGLVALSEGEDDEGLSLNLFTGNALEFDWASVIKDYSGFDMIIGNPPYVCSRNMDERTLKLLNKWSVTKSGHPDLYIPFFQIGYENLTENGVLGLITVNTFIKSINGRALRSYIANNKSMMRIINFGGEQVFKDKNTYTCICFLYKTEGELKYRRTGTDSLHELNDNHFFSFSYESLNNHEGWNLVNSTRVNKFIKNIEKVGVPFKKKFVTKNGIATLKNDIYKFKPTNEDERYYHMVKDGVDYKIEKAICKGIVNANKIKKESDLKTKEEKIIFPYTYEDSGQIKIISEARFKRNYPFAYRYLRQQRWRLDERDKGNVNGYERWYAFGRRQSMERYANKLFFPHICERPTFVISRDPDLLFYNGIAVVGDSLQELRLLKSLMESDVFFKYIKNTTKDYSSGYISMSRNYLKNFGIPELTPEEKAILRKKDTDANTFWLAIYDREIALLSQ